MQLLDEQLQFDEGPKGPKLSNLQVFTLIWFRPKLVFDFIAEYKHREYFYLGLLPAAILALTHILNDQSAMGLAYLISVFVSFVVSSYIMTLLAKSQYGSIASVSDTFYGYAYANVASFIGLLGSYITSGVISDGHVDSNLLLIGGVISLVAGIWAIVLSVNAMASIHHISRGNAFALSFGVGIISSIILFLVSLFIGYQFPSTLDQVLNAFQ